MVGLGEQPILCFRLEDEGRTTICTVVWAGQHICDELAALTSGAV